MRGSQIRVGPEILVNMVNCRIGAMLDSIFLIRCRVLVILPLIIAQKVLLVRQTLRTDPGTTTYHKSASSETSH